MNGLIYEWQAPIPFEERKLPLFPDKVFPDTIEKFVSELTRSTETPRDLAALTTMGAISTAVHSKYMIKTKVDHAESLNIWTLVALPPGSRKSSVFSKVMQPIEKYERLIAKSLKPKIREITSKNKGVEARIREMRLKAAKASATKFEEHQKEILELEGKIEKIPIIPQLSASDITPESLAILMKDNNGCMSVLSDEGGIFDTLSGRYSSGVANLDLFLKGHSGGSARINRASREPDLLDRVILSIALTVQPDLLQGIASNKTLRGRGLLGRFLYALPCSNLGYRNLSEGPIPDEVTEAYDEVLEALLTKSRDEQGEEILCLSEAAQRVWYDYSLYIEINMVPDGLFFHITDWAGKLPGQIARIAGLLHLSRYAKSLSIPKEVTKEDMSNAIKIGHYLSDHALAVFDLMGADPTLDGARSVLQWVKKGRLLEFTFRDCQHENKRFKKANELKPCIEALVERYYIIEREAEKQPHRRKRIFDVNPALYEES